MYKKYPKTMHLPWSPGLQNDDRLLPDINCFLGKSIIATEKCDGENTTLYKGYMHARSIDGKNHVSRNWLKAKHAAIQCMIPEGWRICGENMYACHSIFYESLESYFYVFAVFDENDICLDWLTTKAIAHNLGFPSVPEMFEMNPCHIETLKAMGDAGMKMNSKCGGESLEGYVIRNTEAFHISKWNQNIAKYVRRNHIQTNKNWMYQPVKPNRLAEIEYV